MRGVGDHADVDAVFVMRVEKVLEHQGATALAPSRTALAIQRAEIVGGFFRSINMGVPVDDHARAPLICAWSQVNLAVIPGRWQVGKTDLPGSPEYISPGGMGRCGVWQLQDLWLFIPGSARPRTAGRAVCDAVALSKHVPPLPQAG